MSLSSQLLKFWLLLTFPTVILVVSTHPTSLKGLFYFTALWSVVFLLLERRSFSRFLTAFAINCIFAACYVFIQSHASPGSYGTTTPGGSQTDDSYFFSLAADVVPSDMETRPGYEEYRSGFSTILKVITPFRVDHPLDLVFFMSGVAGLLCVYARQYALDITGDARVGRLTYWLCLLSPMFLMNGGAVLVRDTFVAALFMLSLCSLSRRQYVRVAVCTLLQFYLRPGTALILLVLHGVLLLPDLMGVVRRRKISYKLAICLLAGVLALASIAVWHSVLTGLLNENQVQIGSLSRGGLDEYIQGGGRGTFAMIQRSALYLKVPLSMAFIWLGPFYHPAEIFAPRGFDARALLLTVLYPLWIVGPNAWVWALCLARPPLKQASVLLAFALACAMIGLISLESRHRTIVQPLYYVLAASGFYLAPPRARFVGYCLSAAWLAVQIAYFYLY